MSHNKVIYKLEIFDYRNDDSAMEHIVGYYSTMPKAKKGLRDYLTDVCRLTIEETGLDGHATMKKHAAEGERKGRALLADDGETAYYGEHGIGIYEEYLDEDDDVEDEALAEMEVEAFNAEVAAEVDGSPAERLKDALERSGVVAEVEIDEGEVRVHFEDHEEIHVMIDDSAFAYTIVWSRWSHGTRETAPDSTDHDMALVDDLELAVAVIEKVIEIRRRELSADSTAEEPEYGPVEIAGAGEPVTLPSEAVDKVRLADEPTETRLVAELADKAPYITAPVWRQLDGLKDETKEVLAIAGITSMGDLTRRSDQQLLGIQNFGPEELDDLLTALRKMVEEEQA